MPHRGLCIFGIQFLLYLNWFLRIAEMFGTYIVFWFLADIGYRAGWFILPSTSATSERHKSIFWPQLAPNYTGMSKLIVIKQKLQNDSFNLITIWQYHLHFHFIISEWPLHQPVETRNGYFSVIFGVLRRCDSSMLISAHTS